MAISQVPPYLRQSLGIHFSPGILVFTLETLTLPPNVYIVIFEVKKSFGDVFGLTPSSKLN